MLPGIGAYSSGAIASIAFHIRRPAVDGNVFAGDFPVSWRKKDDITLPKVKENVEEMITKILPEQRVGDFNQSLTGWALQSAFPMGNLFVKPVLSKLFARDINRVSLQSFP